MRSLIRPSTARRLLLRHAGGDDSPRLVPKPRPGTNESSSVVGAHVESTVDRDGLNHVGGHMSLRPHGTVRCANHQRQRSYAVRLSTMQSLWGPRHFVVGFFGVWIVVVHLNHLVLLAHHCTVWPPSRTIACPITKAAASEHSQRTAAAISSGLPIRPIGSSEITFARPSGVPPVKRSIIGVSM